MPHGIRRRLFRCAVSATIGMLLTVGGREVTAQDSPYSYSPVSFPGASFTIVYGVNHADEIVGSYRDTANNMHGFLRRDGKFTSIDYPEAIFTQVRGISPAGDVVGAYRLTGEPEANAHGFVLTKQGRFTSVNIPGHTSTVAVRLLSDGTIIGCNHEAAPDAMHGMKLAGGKLSDLDRPASMHTGATPDGTTIVGFYTDRTAGTSRGRAYVLNGSTFTPFDVPGSAATSAQDINTAGAIVGIYGVNGINHGFVREQEVYTTLNVPGAASTSAFGISDDGTVVGSFVDAGGATRGFIAMRK